MIEQFKVGEVALIIEGPYKGRECTILTALKPTSGWDVRNGQKVEGMFYEVHIHGVKPSAPTTKFHARPPGIIKKKPPREELGNWDEIPYWHPYKNRVGV